MALRARFWWSINGLFRACAAASVALWRLLHQNKGKSAPNWPAVREGSLCSGRVCGLWHHDQAAGELIATWVAGDRLPDYAFALSPARYDDAGYVASLDEMHMNGEL